jgi:carboxylate-amine ligase
MRTKEPPFTIGIEEEYLLVDKQTRDLAVEPPDELLAICEASIQGQVRHELMRSQIEIGTKVCHSIAEARHELASLRATVAEVAGAFGLAPIASSTHPFARWQLQHHTDKERYNILAQDLQVVARRLIICGMHVHVGIGDDDLRIDLLNQAAYFIPHLLALSTSSPFWQGELTGLKSYRLSVFDEVPRTGLPPQFSSFAEYQRTVDVLINAGLIEDGSKIWWDLRPSARFPTLEMRIADMCPLLDDVICIAALFLCVCRMLYRLRRNNQRWRHYASFLINENRWRAQRYGVQEGLFDFGKGEIVPFDDLIDELIELIRIDAEHFDCVDEIKRARTIVRNGTSADRQVNEYQAMLEAGKSEKAALRKVVDSLMRETLIGTEEAEIKIAAGTKKAKKPARKKRRAAAKSAASS